MEATDRPVTLGWSLFDYIATGVYTYPYSYITPLQIIIASNFGYDAYKEKFQVGAPPSESQPANLPPIDPDQSATDDLF